MDKVTLTPYLAFDGQSREAMEFYKSIFGGELTAQTHGEAMGDKAQPELKDKVMHASLEGEVELFASDGPDSGKEGSGKVTLCLGGNDEAKLTKYFEGLSQGGKVTQPLKKQFWGDTFGMLTDKFDVNWMVNIAAPKPE